MKNKQGKEMSLGYEEKLKQVKKPVISNNEGQLSIDLPKPLPTIEETQQAIVDLDTFQNIYNQVKQLVDKQINGLSDIIIIVGVTIQIIERRNEE